MTEPAPRVIALDLNTTGYQHILGGPPVSGALAVARGMTAYCPPDTEHNVVNTETGVLRYVYVVSEVGPGTGP